MYAIVRTGGKQYRVERGQSLLVERLPADDGASVELEPLLYVDGERVLDGDELAAVKVQARVLAHERGPKLRVVKFKPKRGYKRRTGHRQELTRLEVTAVELALGRGEPAAGVAAPAPEPGDIAPPEPGDSAAPEPGDIAPPEPGDIAAPAPEPGDIAASEPGATVTTPDGQEAGDGA